MLRIYRRQSGQQSREGGNKEHIAKKGRSEEVYYMATSSITKNFIVSGTEQAEMFANALEESYKESLSRTQNTIPLKYRDLQEPDELNRMMEKWKKIHE